MSTKQKTKTEQTGNQKESQVGLAVRTSVRAGRLSFNHNETLVEE